MKTGIKLIYAGLLILAGVGFAYGTNELPVVNQDIELQKYRIENALGEAVVSWLSDANESAGVECERLVDSLLALPEPSIKAYFVAAQATYLRGKPQKAILILEDLISKHPNKPAEVMQFPVSIVSRFWIGTIARHSGDMTKAKSVYETIRKNLRGREGENSLAMICNLYLAEIESKHMKRDDLALARLEEIKQLEKPAGHWGEQYEVYKAWTMYEHTRISKGKAQAAHELIRYEEAAISPMVAAAHHGLCGMRRVIDYSRPEHLRSGIIGRALLDSFRNDTISPIDWSLVTLVYGVSYLGEAQQAQHAQKEELRLEARKHYLEAEKYCSELFDDDSFFSPIAGIYLARCKKAQGKTVEAESILEKVKTKYPGYDSTVTELRESWKKEGESKK
jgi:tetratricopeptide (TPR) repeat protein